MNKPALLIAFFVLAGCDVTGTAMLSGLQPTQEPTPTATEDASPTPTPSPTATPLDWDAGHPPGATAACFTVTNAAILVGSWTWCAEYNGRDWVVANMEVANMAPDMGCIIRPIHAIGFGFWDDTGIYFEVGRDSEMWIVDVAPTLDPMEWAGSLVPGYYQWAMGTDTCRPVVANQGLNPDDMPATLTIPQLVF